ncbi:MAG TPA: hypothetical protein VKG25_26350 [Bryobacteraceae bacterium]|nr:hypothetical protein [Bryobacteraceae bacterium]
MRQLALFVFIGLAWGDNPAPTARDAYVQENAQGTRVRSARLKDTLQVEVCKTDYDAFAKAQDPPPALSLYFDGLLMKGLPAVRPQPLPEPKVDPNQTVKTDTACSGTSRSQIEVAAKAASEKDADAKAAAAKLAAETDTTKKKPLEEEASAKSAAAEAAKEALSEAKAAANARYVLKYYLDAQYAAKADMKDPWLRLLERPWESRPVEVSLGAANGIPGASDASIDFERLNLWWLAGWAVVFIVALWLFAGYARTTNIIRDSGQLPANVPAGTMKAYSLARTQMAIWTFLVAGALAFIFMVTWNENTVSPGILVLLGVSFGTTILASVVDGDDPPTPTSGSFRKDLIEGQGPEFHRYQMALFTVILAVIFVVKTASGLAMPEFDSTLLGLMGISSGTYLGFKLQGK